jgi:hypothetical protein
MKLYSQIVTYILFALIFASCTTSPASVTSTIAIPSETPQPTQTTTSTPTLTPTITPTATEAGPKVGDTKVEVINGVTETFTYHVETNADGQEVARGWFRPLIVDMPFYNLSRALTPDGNGGLIQGKDVGLITVYVEDNVPGDETIQSFIHPAVPFKNYTQWSEYDNFVDTSLFEHYFGTNSPFTPTTKQNEAYFKDIEDGNFPYTFMIVSTPITWNIGPGPDSGGAKIFVTGYTDDATMKQNGFTVWHDEKNMNFATKFDGLDAQGNLLGEIAVNKPLNELTNKELSILPLYHVTTVIDNPNQDVSQVGFDGLLQGLIQHATTDTPPEITIQK